MVGGTISNMISAIELCPEYDITIFELNAEIGLPTTSPGHIHDINLLATYLDSDQIEFLRPYSITHGHTLRSEWVLKHLGSLAAKKGVNVLTRTRITECYTSPTGFTVEYIGAGSKGSGQIECEHLIDDRQWTYTAPGSKQHNLDGLNGTLRPDFGEFIDIYGGTSLSSDCLSLPKAVYSLPRHEGLTEVWQESLDWYPQHGWIETIECSLPRDLSQRSIDAQIIEGRRIAKKVNY